MKFLKHNILSHFLPSCSPPSSLSSSKLVAPHKGGSFIENVNQAEYFDISNQENPFFLIEGHLDSERHAKALLAYWPIGLLDNLMDYGVCE